MYHLVKKSIAGESAGNPGVSVCAEHGQKPAKKNEKNDKKQQKRKKGEYKQGFGNEVHRNRCGIHADTKCRVNTRIHN